MEGSLGHSLLVFERQEPRNVHNMKPLHMSSVAGGIRKRVRDSIKHRTSLRLSRFDQGRDIPQDVCPTPIKEVQNETQLKVEHRRQQLEKWKLEKAQKKKEEALQKKKPFIAGIPHAPLYVLPPPPSKAAPSTSGRVTRSTSRKAAETKVSTNKVAEKKVETQQSAAFTKSFAPKNATFKPPKLKNPVTLPPFTLNRNKPKSTITFNPIVHPTRPNANTSSSVSSSEGSSTMLNDNKPKRKFVKTPMKFAKHMTSSSDSDSTTGNFRRNVHNRAPPPRKVQLTTQASSDTNSSDNSSSSKSADAKQTKKVIQSKPLPNPVQLKKSEPIRMVKESPKIEKRPTRAAKQKALTSIEQQRANKNKAIKTVLAQPIEKSPQVVIEPLVIDKTKPLRSIANSTGEGTPKKSERKSVSKRNSTPKRPIPKSESSSEEKMRLGTPKNLSPMTELSTPSNLDCSGSASNISPFVCLSRGKDNARREMIQKAREGLLGAELEAEEDSVSYFRQLLDSEIQKITLACDRWDSIYDEVELPEFVQGLVLSAVGQGRLLMAQKFQQFLSLIERCASAEANIDTVTVTDLRGFWDMIYLQVKNIDLRFSELEELRVKNWSLELHQSQQRPGCSIKTAGDAATKKKAAVRGRKSRVTAGPSKIKEMIAAARKAKQQQDSDTKSTASSTTTLLAIPDEEKTFEAGFFSVRSPIRSPTTPGTPAANKSLLKNVLSSEARKACGSCSKNTSNAMLRASILGKNMQIEGVSPLELTPKPIPINLNATPARSILKSGKKQSLKKSSKKSIKTVLFDQNESDEGILASNLTSVSDPMELTTEVDKENEVICLSSTDSVQIIDSVKKSVRESSEIVKARKSGGKSTEIVSAKRPSKKSSDLVESTRKSDVKSTETSKSTGRKSKLQRQNALTSSPIKTRRQAKSLQPFLIDEFTPQSSVLKELDNITPDSTSIFNVTSDFGAKNPTPRRSKRLTQINSEDDDLIKFDSPVKNVARRSSKRRAVN